MDTTTVLEIIKMIEAAKVNNETSPGYEKGFQCATHEEYQAYLQGTVDALESTIGHLQSYIEGQLNALENSTG